MRTRHRRAYGEGVVDLGSRPVPLQNWFLTTQQRGNAHSHLPTWSVGNHVEVLVHGAAYFDRLAAEVDALRARLAVHEGAVPGATAPEAAPPAPAADDAEPLTDVVGPPSDPSPTDPTAGVGQTSGSASTTEGSAHGHA
jgi:hypothetical protein